MAKHIKLNIKKKLRIEIRPSDKASVHGGQLSTIALLNESGLINLIKQYPALDPRTNKNHGFEPDVYVIAFLVGLASGGKSLADIESLNNDIPLKEILGVKKIPDQSALGEWLRALGDDGWRALRQINRQFVVWALKRIPKERLLTNGRLWAFFDDTQIEVSGNKYEGAKINYNGDLAFSFQTLWVGPFVVDGVFGATSDSNQISNDVSNRLPELLEENHGIWKDYLTHFFADSASSSGYYLGLIEEHFTNWSVSYNRWDSPLTRLAENMPQWAWSKPKEIQLKNKKKAQAQYCWMRYQPSGCKKPREFALMRSRAEDELMWSYRFIVCDEETGKMPAEIAFERHNLKGDYERRFKELLDELDLHHPACLSLAANRNFYAIVILAYNVMQAFKYLYLSDDALGWGIHRLIRNWLLLPAQMVRHSRFLTICLYVSEQIGKWFSEFMNKTFLQWRVVSRACYFESG